MRYPILVSLVFVLPVLAGDGAEVAIPVPGGGKLAGNHHAPEKPNGACVVIAPGQGYHKDLPLITESAASLRAAGFHVVRFNWRYFTAGGKPAPDLAAELQDLEAALAYARTIDGVDRVVLAGKSLGSLVAVLRAARKSDDLAGVALLTYPVTIPGRDGEPWPGSDQLAQVGQPALIVCGDQDPLARLKELYALAAKSKHSPQVAIVPGDHGFRDADKDEAKTKENVDLAVRIFTLWAKRRAG